MTIGKDIDHDKPLLIEGPKAASTAPVIELEASDQAADHGAAETDSDDTDSAASFVPPAAQSHWHWPLAAGVVLAAAVGAMAGAGTTATLWRNGDSSASVAAADAAKNLRDSVAQLNGELTALKTGIANAQRSASTQFGKLAERIERSEKAQEKAIAEPAAKLARIQDSIDRLEKRQQQAAATPSEDITGSIAPKEPAKPHIAAGWRLHDFYDGRAVVENRNGTLFRVGPGSNLPGLGKVETVKRDNGRIVVVTAGGIIAGLAETRRPYFSPRW